MRIALDTNILVYAEGVNGPEKRTQTLTILRGLSSDTVVIPAQVLGELFNVLTRKAGRSPADARDAVLAWRDNFSVIGVTPEVMLAAVDLSTNHQFAIWDAVILAAASAAACRMLLSEDLHNGFAYGGVTVVNPFASPRHAMLDLLLEIGDDQHGNTG